MVPLSHPLSSGDQVEILTSKKQTPNPDWMQFVVTSKARGRIRHWLNEKRRKAAEMGRELLERRLRRARLSLDDSAIARVASRLKFPSTEHLLYEIGAGLYDPDDFVDAVSRGGAAEEEPARDTARLEVERFTEDAREVGRTALVVAGERHTDLAVQYAPCCSPIPGDDVFGYTSRTGVVKIHRASCRNAPHLMLEHADRIIPVEWSRQKDVQFVAALRLIGEDRVGIVSDITKVISKNLKTNIRSITVEGEHGVFEGRIVLYVSGLDQLRRIMQRLARVDGIHGVNRLEQGATAAP
jgi:(p)ppGpp synthase/HD superfamily hydrolase